MGLNAQQTYKQRRKHGSEVELEIYKKNYRKLRSIAKGSWGVSDKCAWIGKEHKGRHVAITFIPRGARVTARLRADILSHYSLAHPHITNIIDVFVLPSHLAVVKEYVEGWNLLTLMENKIGLLKEAQARWFFQQMVIALDYLHRRDIAHKEIKLENVIVSAQSKKGQPPLIKLTGFKAATHERVQTTNTSDSRVYEYKAPEMWGKSMWGQQMSPQYDGKAADMWALGVCLYVMLFGKYPFQRPRRAYRDDEVHDLLSNFEFPDDIEVSDEVKNLISGLLMYEKSDRLTVRNLYHNPWFQNGLNPQALEMNEKLDDDKFVAPLYKARQTLEAVQEALEQARTTTNPEGIWSDNKEDGPDEQDDHQFQMFSPEESEDIMQVKSYPSSGKEILMAE